ncbi:MAG: sugar ABC transporter permease [Deltaproteobacteria bacterium]|nr:sugar ABC transporter permease [Deltaproteobacteria bacterium]MBW2121940.1 sugar ABC transporter permease [Deltaproteobacteria bacterium]
MLRRKDLTYSQKESRLGLKLLLPSVLFVGVLIVLPIFYNIYLSFHFVSGYDPTHPRFVALDNYVRLLGNEVFWSDLRNAIIYTFGSVLLQLSLGLSIALFLNQEFTGRNLLRGIVLLPYLIPTVCAVFMARWMLDPVQGITNVMLRTIFGFTVNWLGSPGSAMFSAMAVNTWRFFPFVEIALLARLQTISPSLYEAAEIDGASKFRRFVHITLPELAAVLFVVALLRTIWAFNDFQLIYILTGGGPMNSTETLPLLAYREAFDNNNIGMGCTVAMFMTIFLISVFGLYYKIFNPLRETK